MDKSQTLPAVSPPPVEWAGTIALRSQNRNWGNEKRMALLAAIGTQGSITAAAKKIGLSYKAAWDAVDAMNNLAGEPLVLRTTGGQRGGGATLTTRALELIALYQTVSREHESFMARLARLDASSSRNLELIGHMMIQTSARNNLAGTVQQIKSGAVNDEVILDIGGGQHIVATITKESVLNLGLQPAKRALAFIKASSVIVGLPDGMPSLSARNQLHGRVSRVVNGAVNAEVCIELEQGSVITAMISMHSVGTLGLQEKTRAVAIFKASSVMLGVTE